MPGPETLFWPESFAAWAEAIRNAGLVVGGIAAFGVAAWALHLNRLRTKNDSKRLDNEAERLRQQAQALENDRHRLVNDTYVKAIEQLGHEKMEVRLGAIYALERIARDAEDFDLHWSIMETLCAYVRERPAYNWPENLAKEIFEPQYYDNFECNVTVSRKLPPTDVTAIFNVLRRRSDKKKQQELERKCLLNFRQIDLNYADLSRLCLQRADFRDANLFASDLSNSNFEDSDFENAILTSTVLMFSNFLRVDFHGANLEMVKSFNGKFDNAYFNEVNLMESRFSVCSFGYCDFEYTNLSGSFLFCSYMRNAIFEGSNLTYCDFHGVQLNGATFDGSDISGAIFCGGAYGPARFSQHPRDLGAAWDEDDPPKGLDEIIIDP